MRRFVLPLVIVTLGASLLGGCLGGKSQPSRFYVLSPLSSETGKQFAAVEHSVAIGVGPVQLPQYLDRPEIVTRTSHNELHLSEFERWAEQLNANFAHVLAENLSILLSTDRVTVFPWEESTPIDYRVEMEVVRFERNAGGDTLLIARWSIFGPERKKMLLTRQSSFSEPTGGKDYEATVSAMSRTLGNLSREIATAVETVSR